MQMIPVSSSNLAAIGYDHQKAILRIQFIKSGTYDYQNVPLHVFEELMSALSKGQYFDRYVKNGGYSFSKA